MITVLLWILAFNILGAIAFVAIAKRSSVLVDDDGRPVRAPSDLPEAIAGEPVQLVRRIGAADPQLPDVH
ncbi:hypothetical protein J7643_11410 [bacterium]|nr:hypothetical protein [bacterium]